MTDLGLDPNGLPVILLDVDGVLNATGPYPGRTTKNPRYNDIWGIKMDTGLAFTNGRDWRIRWSHPLTVRIWAIHQSGLAEFRWASTWNCDIANIAKLLDLPDFPVAFDNRGLHWRVVPGLKRRAAQHVLEVEKRRLIWIDDQEAPHGWEPAHATMSAGGRALLIRPNEALGLGPEHMDRIEQYVGLSATPDPEVAA